MADTSGQGSSQWPELPYDGWTDTRRALHMMTQIVGKVKLALAPKQPHWWHTTLIVTPRGLTTGCLRSGQATFQIDFDLLEGELRIESCSRSAGGLSVDRRNPPIRLPLQSDTIAKFYGFVTEGLRSRGVNVKIWPHPVEVAESIPFGEDTAEFRFDDDFARRFHFALSRADAALRGLQNEFVGKASPVHFFWGAFDLAYTRFSGRPAPPHPGGYPNVGISVMREAYSHECASGGFWPGGGGLDEAAFYAYAYPEPEGLKDWPIPSPAYYHPNLREFILPYAEVRISQEPEALVGSFFRSAFNGAAELARWDRALFRLG